MDILKSILRLIFSIAKHFCMASKSYRVIGLSLFGLAALIKTGDFNWLYFFLFLYLCSIAYAYLGYMSASNDSRKSALEYLVNQQGNFAFRRVEVPDHFLQLIKEWFRLNEGDMVGQFTQPFVIYQCLPRNGNSFLPSWVTFINPFSSSIILVNQKIDFTLLKPLQVFNLFHELGHCTPHSKAVLARIMLVVETTAFNLCIIMIFSDMSMYDKYDRSMFAFFGTAYIFLNYRYWKFAGGRGIIESIADSYAMNAMTLLDIKNAKKVGEYFYSTWTRELSALKRLSELSTRKSNLRRHLVYVDRVLHSENAHLRKPLGFDILLLQDLLFVVFCIWQGWRAPKISINENDTFFLISVIVAVVISTVIKRNEAKVLTRKIEQQINLNMSL